jgi:hypothetical protein
VLAAAGSGVDRADLARVISGWELDGAWLARDLIVKHTLILAL